MTAELQAVLDRLAGPPDEAVRQLVDYVRRPSISATGEGIRDTAGYIAERMNRWGLDAALVETAGLPAVLGRTPPRPGRFTVLVYGHYDVQPPDPLDAWHSPPFTPTLRDGRIYGRGTGDNKGQHLAHLLAVRAWHEVHGETPCNVVVLLDGEEEIGSPHLPELAREHADALAADVVVWSDGPVHDSGEPTITFGVRGIVVFQLRATGANRPLHSGNWGGVPPNPVWTLVQLLATMRGAGGRVTIDGFYDSATPPSAAERAAMDRLPVDIAGLMRDIGIAELDQPAEWTVPERLSVRPTLTINGVRAGSLHHTIIPNEATVRCDARLVDGMTVQDTFDKIARHVARHAPTVQCRLLAGMEPSRTPLDSPYTEPIRRAIRQVEGQDPVLVPALGGSLPDYVFTKVLGIPSLGVPFANPDEANHAPNENLELARYLNAMRTSAAILGHLPSAVGGRVS
jgi:acetylornithine deacetylase/succinyl-diaminopimelate desuccinylase-like protein